MSKLARLPTLTLWGQRSRQTAVTLVTLLRAGVTIRSLVLGSAAPSVDRPRRPPLAPWSDDPADLARRIGIPTIPVRQRQELETILDRDEPLADCALVSCFPWRIPRSIYERYPLGMLNIHPSPLPDYRGPSPLFWQYRDGCLRTAVTLHRITEELDAGPIVAQVACDLPLGFPGDRLESWLAWYGTGLALEYLQSGTIEKPQHAHPALRSWAPSPRQEDRTVAPDWPAWRVAHFLAGVLPLGYRALVRDGQGQLFRIERFVAWTSRPGRAPLESRVLYLRFGDSWITVEATALQSEDRVGRSVLRQ
ncbi:MAG: formyltransferase family protein [Thermomicrobium sp.]|nr:formyltransferase family protein [Thermomicrobium sp.]MDW8059976.1 formyltransferase family protein [Thermomicrobium sp.]